ncbi:hypothetical protein A4G29_08190 [Mycobacterium kansasii]|nr:hypothetical protein A4G29_08190 [Mycobacterium kansasii]
MQPEAQPVSHHEMTIWLPRSIPLEEGIAKVTAIVPAGGSGFGTARDSLETDATHPQRDRQRRPA